MSASDDWRAPVATNKQSRIEIVPHTQRVPDGHLCKLATSRHSPTSAVMCHMSGIALWKQHRPPKPFA